MKANLLVLALLVQILAFAGSATVAAHPVGETAPYLLSEYLKVHDALASDRVEGVVEAAAKIASTANEMSSHTSGAEKTLYENLAGAAGRMKGDDLAELRSRLGELTAAVKALLLAAEAQGWRLFRCAMAGEEWIQTDEKVRNPYYGPAMLTCGEPVEPGAKR